LDGHQPATIRNFSGNRADNAGKKIWPGHSARAKTAFHLKVLSSAGTLKDQMAESFAGSPGAFGPVIGF
jgi:hypothetical protein